MMNGFRGLYSRIGGYYFSNQKSRDLTRGYYKQLLELAEKYDVFKKVSTRYELPDGSKQFGKTILNNPETYFTEDIMKQLDDAAAKEFKYARSD